MKKLLVWVSFLSLFSCQNSIPHNRSESVRLEDKIGINTAKELKKEKELYLIGFGGSSGVEMKTKTIALSFICYQKVNIEQARELMVFCVEKLLKNFNTHEELKPFLCNFPFTYKNTDIVIFFHNQKDQSSIPPPFLSAVLIDIKGNIQYDSFKSVGTINTINKEPYPEAYEKVFGKKLILSKETVEKPCSSLVPEKKSLTAPK